MGAIPWGCPVHGQELKRCCAYWSGFTDDQRSREYVLGLVWLGTPKWLETVLAIGRTTA